MTSFLEFNDIGIIKIIRKCISYLVNSSRKLTNQKFWSKKELNLYQQNVKAKHIFYSDLLEEEFLNFPAMVSTKEIWEMLELSNEG